MKTRFRITSLLLVAALWLSGCSAFQPAGKASGSALDAASLIEKLRSAGATVEVANEIEQPFFAVKGQVIRVNGLDVQVFEYSSESAAAKDAELISADGGSVGTTMIMWVATPHFLTSGKVIVLYVGEDASVVQLLESALSL